MFQFAIISILLLLAHTYLLYPIFLSLLARKALFHHFPTTNPVLPNDLPSVSLIVAAYNEEGVIERKLKNSFTLNYPRELFDMVLASDGSSDGTVAAAKRFAQCSGARLQILDLDRAGKASALNCAIPFTTGEIVIFSDANTILDSQAIRELVKYFSNSKVGCVSGRLVLSNPSGVTSGKGESFYWRYESRLKALESSLGYVAGANGALYAIRRSLFVPLPPHTINDDFLVSMRIVAAGFYCLDEPQALAYEEVAPSISNEFERHVRDGAGHYLALWDLRCLLNPVVGTRSFIFWSHRALRWAAPFLLILLIILSLLLAYSPVFYILLLSQVFFYLLAFSGCILMHWRRLPVFLYVPFYFFNLNAALFLGFLRVMRGAATPAWRTTPRAPS